jgi:PAS domain S-box-containing protein
MAEANFQNLLDKNFDGVIFTDLDGKIRYLNDSAESYFSRKKGELLNLPFGLPIVEDGRAELEIPKSNGQVLAVEMRIKETEWNGEKGYLTSLRDLSDRKKLEKKLIESQKQYKMLFNDAADPILIHTVRGDILQVNDLASAIFGIGHKKLADSNLYDLLDTEEKLDVEHYFRKISEDNQEVFEAKFKTRSQKPFYAELHSKLITYDENPAIMSIGRDITRRKIAEEQLIVHQRALESIRNGVVITDARKDDNPIIYTNEAFNKITGYSDEEVLGKNCRFLQGEDKNQTSAKIIRNAVRLGKGCQVVIRNYRKDGKLFWNELKIAPVKDASDTITHYVGVQNDITERIIAEEALNDERNLLRSLIDNLPDPIFVKNKEFEFILCNQAFASLLGVESPKDVIGKSDFYFYSEKDAKNFRADDKKVLNTGKPLLNQEIELPDESGNNRVFLSSKTPLRNRKGEIAGVIGISNDVTERNRLEAQLIQAQKMESLGKIAGGIAHDFNNVMAVISGGTQMLEFQELNKRGKKYIDMIKSGIARGQSVTERLLTFTRSRTPLVQPVSLQDFLEEMREVAEYTLPKNIETMVEDYEGEGKVLAETGQLRQVLMNLCINAADAMPDGGKLTMSIHEPEHEELLKYSEDTGIPYLCFSVSDNGAGMPSEIQEQIFEPFFTTKEREKGTGLGLAVVYKIIKNHNGWISVRSEQGKGSTFTVALPSSQKNISSNLSEIENDEWRGKGERVLLVEDEDAIRDLVSELLESNGYRVLTAENGRRALEEFEKNDEQINVVVTDLGLPELNGKDLVKELRKKNNEVQVIGATGYVVEDGHASLLDQGFSAILQKPFDLHKLLETINSLLEK